MSIFNISGGGTNGILIGEMGSVVTNDTSVGGAGDHIDIPTKLKKIHGVYLCCVNDDACTLIASDSSGNIFRTNISFLATSYSYKVYAKSAMIENGFYKIHFDSGYVSKGTYVYILVGE